VGVFVDAVSTQDINKMMGFVNSSAQYDGREFRPTVIYMASQIREREKPNYPPESLNRHQILHRDVMNYATRTNSCKAISLLHCVATVLDREFFNGEELEET
jgi:hypothetical protein